MYIFKRLTRGVQKVLQIDIQKIHKALEFDFILFNPSKYSPLAATHSETPQSSPPLVYPPDTDILHFPLHFWRYNVYLKTFF